MAPGSTTANQIYISPNSSFITSNTSGKINSISFKNFDESRPVKHITENAVSIMQTLRDKYPEWNATFYYSYIAQPDMFELVLFYERKDYDIYNQDDELTDGRRFLSMKLPYINIFKKQTNEDNLNYFIATAVEAAEQELDNMVHDVDPDGFWAVKK